MAATIRTARDPNLALASIIGPVSNRVRGRTLGRLPVSWKSGRVWLASRGAEVRLAVRVAVAGVAAFAAAHLLGLAQGYWAVFTAVIVMQASVGGSLKATIDRLIGTLGGALYGGAVAVLVARDSPAAIAFALFVALLPLAFVAAIDPRFRVAPVTAVIVLISPFGQQANPILFTFDRIVEIALGSVVALAVSLLILPARAHSLLAERTAKLLDLLADFLVLILGGLTQSVDSVELRRLQVASRRTLVALEAVADEAKRERTIHLTEDPDPDPIVRTSMRLRNDIIIVARAAVKPLPAPLDARLGTALARVAATGGAFLRGLAVAFAGRTRPPSLEDFDVALRAYHAEIATLREELALRGFPADVVGRLFTLGFALDQLRQNAGDLTDRATEFAREAAPAASA